MPYLQVHTAERLASRNLVNGADAEHAAQLDDKSLEWIGALIRGDIFGYVNPGDPGPAAADSLVDAWLTHRGIGVHGKQWAAALIAAAFATDSAHIALDRALATLPEDAGLVRSQRLVFDLFDWGADRDAALELVRSRWGHLHWIHTLHNAALVSVGLLWGQDFADAVGTTIAGGWDTDSTAATVGSAYGALHGVDAIPAELVGTTHHRVRSAVMGEDRVTIRELVERTSRVRAVLVDARG